jgi:hypothetical protein
MSSPALHTRSVNISPSLGMPPVAVAVLRILAYFDIFHYPLNREEIRQYLGRPVDEHFLDQWLDYLVAAKRIYRYHDLYSLQNNPLLGLRRKEGNERAAALLKKAGSIGRFLYRFPYVRAVGVSGSLSKNFADEKADIDFFIITRSNRLWLARTLMFLFVKLAALFGKRDMYCMNYYIDEDAMLLKEQNIFVAIELKTILPVAGNDTMQQFFRCNGWADEWFPVCEYRQAARPDPRPGLFKRCVEWLFNNKLGNKIDDRLFKLSARRWNDKKNNGKRNGKGLIVAMDAGKHFSRSNPGSFQEKVLKAYEEKLQQLK